MGRLEVRAVARRRLPPPGRGAGGSRQAAIAGPGAGAAGISRRRHARRDRGIAQAARLVRRRAAAAALAWLAGLAAGSSTTGLAAEAAGGPAEAQAPAGAAQPPAEGFGLGRPAAPGEIAAWDIDVRPDGAGLPEGAGTAASGAPVYAAQCAVCHGAAGEGGVADRLVGYDPASTPPFGPRYEAWRAGRDDVPFSVGNYWPYATTLFDYIRRAMPPNEPGGLTPDEVYGLVAWILAENGIIAQDAVMNAETLPAVEMPARHVFVPQER